MPGLSFLAKKSWHTTNLKNVEQVWIAEKKDAKEKKKIAEFEKQIKEERQIQELRALQAASGNAVKMVDNSLDWMYEGPSAASLQKESSEEYLLGKIFKGGSSSGASSSSGSGSAAGTMAAAASGPGITRAGNDPKWVNKINSKNDAFTRVHEDPFLFIKQQEKLKREAVLNNPLKMEKVRNIIAAEMERDRQAKGGKKEAKRERKDKKHAKKGEKRKEKRKEKKKEKGGGEGAERKDRDAIESASESDSSENSNHRTEVRRGDKHATGSTNTADRIEGEDAVDNVDARPEKRSKRDHSLDASAMGGSGSDRAGEEALDKHVVSDHRSNSSYYIASSSTNSDNSKRRRRSSSSSSGGGGGDSGDEIKESDKLTRHDDLTQQGAAASTSQLERPAERAHFRDRNHSRDKEWASTASRNRQGERDTEGRRDGSRYVDRNDWRSGNGDKYSDRDRERSETRHRDRDNYVRRSSSDRHGASTHDSRERSRDEDRYGDGFRSRGRDRDRGDTKNTSIRNEREYSQEGKRVPPESTGTVAVAGGSTDKPHRAGYGLDAHGSHAPASSSSLSSSAMHSIPDGGDVSNNASCSSSSSSSSSGGGGGGGGGADSNAVRAYSGPRPDLIRRKQQQAVAERAVKLDRGASSGGVKALSAEEKARRLMEMQENAQTNDAMRLQRLGQPDDETQSELKKAASGEEAAFLAEMRVEAFSNASATSLQERLQQNKYYSQSGAQLNSHGFTSK